jgi:hypothetical protein
MIEWKPLASLFRRVPIKSWDDVDYMFGNVFYDLDGNKIERGEKLRSINVRRPAVINNSKMIVGDLIPSSSWGSSLAGMLTRESWDSLRKLFLNANNYICELCGQKSGTLDLHEIWGYEFPPDNEWELRDKSNVFGIQKLEGFFTVCRDCHRCFHLGKANVDGVYQATLKRLMALNCWGKSTMDRYCTILDERYSYTNQISWILNLSSVQHPEGGVTLRRTWCLFEEEPRFVMSPSKYGGNNLTALMNIKWKFEGELQWRENRF